MSVSGLAITAMTGEDLQAVLAIDQQSPSPWSLRQLEGELFVATGVQLICRSPVTGKVLGFVLSRQAGDEAEIMRLGVEPKHRRQGVASRLLHELLSLLGSKGVCRCHLELRAKNIPARRLYEKFDFQVTGLRKNYYTSPNDDAVCMSLAITTPKSATPSAR